MEKKNISEIILEEVLKTNYRLGKLEEKVDAGFKRMDGMDKKIDLLQEEVEDMKDDIKDIKLSLFEFTEIHTYLGNKVFGDHEERITSLEAVHA